MAGKELDSMSLSELRLLSAFLAMETTDSLLCLAMFAFINPAHVGKGYESYSKKFVKKLITEIESNHGNVLDELYEQYGSYMISFKDDNPVKENERVCKCISFLFPDCFKLSICPKSRKLVVPLQCSLNMLEGDTGCSVWPSSLFLSELILSYPHIFSGKSCFEVGSGVGLVGICLAHVKASKAAQSTSSVITDNEIDRACFVFPGSNVILSDGDLSTLANMKLNLEKNRLNTETNLPETSIENQNVVSSSHGHFIPCHQVKCIHLPWESASEKELQNFMPEIILGADVIYDPSCLPHLVKVLAILLNKKKSYMENREGSIPNSFPGDGKVNDAHDLDASSFHAQRINTSEVKGIINNAVDLVSRADPVAYIASVIRNADTFDRFLALADQADLRIKDLTSTLKPFDLLPYMKSYDRSSIRLFTVT
ncbi:hypothetical protein Golax_025057 [Gossypium laxum]|uniref:FAM86 N-terminal domain-containing protein n=1 Tax=Gossypium laxum TaxID=34288 RepID=A0A7J8ZDY2_9ROSI|nr:hypothetical protein [Gossypium laxum]